MCVLFAFDGSYAGEDFAFDSLEQSATTGRNVRNLVGKTEFVDAGYRVATANEREGAVFGCLNPSVGNGAAACGEVVELEYASRAIPEDGLRATDGVGEELAGFGACIKTFPAFGDVHH